MQTPVRANPRMQSALQEVRPDPDSRRITADGMNSGSLCHKLNLLCRAESLGMQAHTLT